MALVAGTVSLAGTVKFGDRRLTMAGCIYW